MKMSRHLRHQSKCDGTIKYVFPGGVYKNKLSVFEELEKMGVRLHEGDKYEEWFACFDFEAYQRDFDEKGMLLKKICWQWKRGRHRIKCMCWCHLV